MCKTAALFGFICKRPSIPFAYLETRGTFLTRQILHALKPTTATEIFRAWLLSSANSWHHVSKARGVRRLPAHTVMDATRKQRETGPLHERAIGKFSSFGLCRVRGLRTLRRERRIFSLVAIVIPVQGMLASGLVIFRLGHQIGSHQRQGRHMLGPSKPNC